MDIDLINKENLNLHKYLVEYKETVLPGLNENTRKALETDISQYRQYCETIGSKALFSDPDKMKDICRKYVQHLSASDFAHQTIKRKVASLRHLIGIAGVPNPWNDKLFSMFFSNMMKQKPARSRQAVPLTYQKLSQLNGLMTDKSLHTLRDRALINLAFDSLYRVSNIRVIQTDHLDFKTNTVFSQWSKTDKTGQGAYSYVSNETLEYISAWIDAAAINQGYLFRRLNRNAVISEDTLSSQSIWNIYKKWGAKVGLPNLSCHSTRTGAVVTMVENGVDSAAIALAGQWKSPAMPIRYAAQVSVRASGMSKIR